MLKIDKDALPFQEDFGLDGPSLGSAVEGDRNYISLSSGGGIDIDFDQNAAFPSSISFDATVSTDLFTTEFRFIELAGFRAPAPEGVALVGVRVQGEDYETIGAGIDFDNSKLFVGRGSVDNVAPTANFERFSEIDIDDVHSPVKVTVRGTSVIVGYKDQTISHDFSLIPQLDSKPFILMSLGAKSFSLSEWAVCGLTNITDNPNAFEVDDCGHLSIEPTEPPFIDQPLLGSVSVEPFGYLSQAPLLLTNNTQEVRLAGLAGSTSKEAIADASVSLTLVLEQNNNTIIDNVPMSYDEGPQSYRALLDGSLLVRGLIYTLTVKAVKGSSVGEWRQTLKAKDRLLEVVGSGAKHY